MLLTTFAFCTSQRFNDQIELIQFKIYLILLSERMLPDRSWAQSASCPSRNRPNSCRIRASCDAIASPWHRRRLRCRRMVHRLGSFRPKADGSRRGTATRTNTNQMIQPLTKSTQFSGPTLKPPKKLISCTACGTTPADVCGRNSLATGEQIRPSVPCFRVFFQLKKTAKQFQDPAASDRNPQLPTDDAQRPNSNGSRSIS